MKKRRLISVLLCISLFFAGGCGQKTAEKQPATQETAEQTAKETHKAERGNKQEIVQENGTQPVEYILTKEEGPDHNKNFTVEARVNGKVMGQGSGHTKKAAEQAAAYQAIRVLRK